MRPGFLQCLPTRTFIVLVFFAGIRGVHSSLSMSAAHGLSLPFWKSCAIKVFDGISESKNDEFLSDNLRLWRVVRETPLNIPPLGAPCFPIRNKDLRWIEEQMQPPKTRGERISVSRCLLILRIHGIDATFASPIFTTSKDFLNLFFVAEVSKKLVNQPFFISVTTGLRTPARRRSEARFDSSLESDRHQSLAALEELGLPLSNTVAIDGRQVSLFAVLNDSVSDIHLKQYKIEWTVETHALFLPLHTQVKNRYQENYTFINAVMELLERPVVRSPVEALRSYDCCESK